MGKIGDLIVRLKLKSEDYEKGLKKAEKETKGFGGALEKIKGIGVAVWAAIGGALVKLGSDLIKATNAMEDKWAMFTAKAKAGWDTFVRTLINGQWGDFVRQFKEATLAAQYLQEALDADTEKSNSIRLQKAAMAEELAALEVLMRDQTKSYKDRAEAAQKYIDKVSPIYQQEIDRLHELKKAYMVDFGKGLWSEDVMTNPSVTKWVEKFLTEYGKTTKHELLRNRTLDETMAIALTPYNPAPKGKDEVKEQRARSAAIEQLGWLGESWGMAYNTLYLFGKQYEQVLNGEAVEVLVSAIENYNKALGAKNSELRRVYGILNSATKQIQKDGEEASNETTAPISREWGAAIQALPSITAPAMAMEVPDIIPDDWLTRNREKIDAALAEAERLAGITNEINMQLESAIVSSLSGATQALTDCIAGIEGADATQVLAALMQPFADTMIQLGEMLIAEGLAISAFKESLESLNPWVALAAGAGLLALGAALSSGIKKLGATAGSGATTTSTAASSSTGTQNIETELTIYVKGSLKGSDIVLSGQRTLNSWAR